MTRKEQIYPAYWPEQCEQDPEYGGRTVPHWHVVEAEAITTRKVLLDARRDGMSVPDISAISPHHRHYGTVLPRLPFEAFDPRHINCFQYLPSMISTRNQMTGSLGRFLHRQYPPEKAEQLIAQYRNELMHTLYQHCMWRANGRRVYVLDQTTFTLLAETPLPPLPASILCMPEHAFYLKLPKRAFEFGVWNNYTGKEDTQSIEGVMISMDNIDPDSDRQRELAYMAVGSGQTVSDRNIAFISLTLGPDAKLDEIRFGDAHSVPNYGSKTMVPVTLVVDNPTDAQGRAGKPNREDDQVVILPKDPNSYANPLLSGAYELGVVIPRVIFGFLLYLQSEHPDIEPVDPAPRRSFKDIRSPKERERAIQNQELRLRGTTRLPILYVGRHLAEEVRLQQQIAEAQWRELCDEPDGGPKTSGRSLDHQIWVRGHWKMQPYGEGRTMRKMIWIRPYVKGPDVAEVMKVRAAKVQRAQASKEGPQVDVIPIPSPKLNRMKVVNGEDT